MERGMKGKQESRRRKAKIKNKKTKTEYQEQRCASCLHRPIRWTVYTVTPITGTSLYPRHRLPFPCLFVIRATATSGEGEALGRVEVGDLEDIRDAEEVGEMSNGEEEGAEVFAGEGK